MTRDELGAAVAQLARDGLFGLDLRLQGGLERQQLHLVQLLRAPVAPVLLLSVRSQSVRRDGAELWSRMVGMGMSE